MARPFSGRPVSFEQFEVLMEKVMEQLRGFHNGEITTKQKAQQSLTEFRKTVSALGQACPAVRKFSIDLEKNLVTKHEILDDLGGENSLNQIIQRLERENQELIEHQAQTADPNEAPVTEESESCTGECTGTGEGCSE